MTDPSSEHFDPRERAKEILRGAMADAHAVAPLDFDAIGERLAEIISPDAGPDSPALDLEPIRDRLAAASRGPWRTHDTHLNWGGHTFTVLGPHQQEPGSGEEGRALHKTEGIAWCPTFEGSPFPPPQNASDNAAFIAAARQDIPALLAEVERLRAILDDSTPYHLIDLTDTGWTLKHPIACRPDLFNCPVNRAAQNIGTAKPTVVFGPLGPGVWRVEMDADKLVFVEREEGPSC